MYTVLCIFFFLHLIIRCNHYFITVICSFFYHFLIFSLLGKFASHTTMICLVKQSKAKFKTCLLVDRKQRLVREPWLSFTKDSTTLNFLKFLIFCNNYYGNYLVHPHKILPAWLRFKLNAMEQVLPAYTVENEIHICLGIWDTEIKKNYLYKNENHFASVGQRANLCLVNFTG